MTIAWQLSHTCRGRIAGSCSCGAVVTTAFGRELLPVVPQTSVPSDARPAWAAVQQQQHTCCSCCLSVLLCLLQQALRELDDLRQSLLSTSAAYLPPGLQAVKQTSVRLS